MEIKNLVKEAVSIVDVASLYVDLKPSGKQFKALCPFHHEKTPSFYIMPDKGTFTCYGCHAFGDIFTMVQQQEGLSFPEALKFLIDRFHLPLSQNNHKNSSSEHFEQINALALHFFKQQLWDTGNGQQARKYLEKRGITEETLQTYNIGMAPNQWNELSTLLKKEGFSDSQGIEMGLLAVSEQGKSYDRFRNRVIIPILSMNNKVLAFGGRALDDQPAKYINSPETPIYKKGNHLFAFNLARQYVRTSQSMILVEGYFDQIALYQAGIRNVAASLGTALTDEQAYLIKRFSDLVYICYDNDSAGQKAALSAVEKLLAHQVSTRVVQLNFGKDPDEVVRKMGSKAFMDQLDQSVEGFRFILQRLGDSTDLKDPLSKSRAIQTLAPIIQKMDDRLVRLDLIKKCEDFFNIPFDEIKRNITLPPGAKPPVTQPSAVPTLAEAEFIKILLTFPDKIVQIKSLIDDDLLKSLSIGPIVLAMLQSSSDNPQITDRITYTSQLLRRLTDPDRQLVQRISEQHDASLQTAAIADEILEKCLLLFIERLNKKRIELLNRQIHMAEQNGNTTQVHELMQKKSQYIKTSRNNKHTTPRSSEGAARRP